MGLLTTIYCNAVLSLSCLYKKITDNINTTTVFAGIWVLVFVLYLPAARAGFVADFTGWLDQVRNHTFWEHINRTNFHVRSLYQFTQFATWVFYKLFGASEWAWHLLFLTLHTICATLLYQLTNCLLSDGGFSQSKPAALLGAVLFSVSPYISETLVWEPSFHFVQGLLFILIILLQVQRLMHTGAARHAVTACLVYFLSTFALEIFYITPWLALSLILFYAYQRGGNTYTRKAITTAIVPMLLLFVVRLIIFRVVYGSWVSRIGPGAVTSVDITSFSKPVKYVFHLLLLGRFFPHDIRQKVYAFCESRAVLAAFYLLVIALLGYVAYRFRAMSGRARVASLYFVWTLITLLLLVPLWFPDILLCIYDRYTYFTDAFLYTLLVLLAYRLRNLYLRMGLIGLFVLASLRFTIQVNRYWWKSEHIISSLLRTVPVTDKTIILLNIPQSMHGIAMIGAEEPSEFKLMHDLTYPQKPMQGKVYDAMAYNMTTPADGAHVTVINDSMVKVTLSQWGTWWWYQTMGGRGYYNADYNITMTDPGHEYLLTLKRPASEYVLLYNVGDVWKIADMNKAGSTQE